MNRYQSSQPPITRTYAALVCLAVTAATGWGLWALADQAADQREAELRQQIATLAQSQAQLLDERSHLQMELVNLQDQVANWRDQVGERGSSANRPHTQVLATSVKDVMETGSTAPSVNMPVERDVGSAQKLLSKLGYGPVGAFGIVGSTTRQAIELFQYKNGLPVTRELDAATLEKLFSGSTMTAAQ